MQKSKGKRSMTKAAEQKKNSIGNQLMRLMGKVSFIWLLLALVWLFVGLVYADMFYMAEQNSYFAFDKLLMKYVLDMNDGYVILTGRLLLLFFHYPLFGGFLLAALLAVSAWLMIKALSLKGYAQLIPVVLVFSYLGWLVSKGLNLYFNEEPGLVLAYPVMVFVLLGLAAIFKYLFSKKKVLSEQKDEGKGAVRQNAVVIAAELLLFVGLMVYTIPFHENTRATAKMNRLMEQEEWEKMIDVASKVKQPNRAVCCFYAIALSQTDQIATKLFDIHYQYPNLHLHNRSGKVDLSTEYYTADGDFYAGLVNTAYHECMERAVIDGPRVFLLKRMFLCALLNEEPALADKYLHMISKMPFEQSFVKRYAPYVDNLDLVTSDVNLSKVKELMPTEDTFEQWYKTPLFIGYNVMLTSGRSYRALVNSLAACLYAKDLGSFYMRTQPLRGQPLAKTFEEAIVFYSMKEKDVSGQFQIAPYVKQTINGFLQEAVKYKGQDRKKVYYDLAPHYGGFYPFYYFFQNIPDDNYIAPKKESAGVN
ncbi:MAG: hypothetical protein IJ244_00855 [Bacteroidaceae bacterium]|nr:hypothetical protein [Bacteroidaceae bacterium]